MSNTLILFKGKGGRTEDTPKMMTSVKEALNDQNIECIIGFNKKTLIAKDATTSQVQTAINGAGLTSKQMARISVTIG